MHEQIKDYMNDVLKAAEPQNAPNYNQLPNDYPEKPTLINKTIKPVFVE